jgi:hypothetical protein
MFTWRALMPPLLEWMTTRLDTVATTLHARQESKARKAATARKKAPVRHHR